MNIEILNLIFIILILLPFILSLTILIFALCTLNNYRYYVNNTTSIKNSRFDIISYKYCKRLILNQLTDKTLQFEVINNGISGIDIENECVFRISEDTIMLFKNEYILLSNWFNWIRYVFLLEKLVKDFNIKRNRFKGLFDEKRIKVKKEMENML